jgi:hypothetical protein
MAWLLLTALVAAPSLFEHVAWTDTFPWWTGSAICDNVNGLYGRSDNVVKVEHIVWLQPAAETTRCGWMKFNLAGIPDNARITHAELRYLVHYFEMSFDFLVTALAIDPVPASGRTLYDAIRSGTVCADRPMGRVWDTTELNAAGIAHVQGSLGRDWAAFGLWGYGWSSILTKRAWITGWNVQPRGDRPQLVVEYDVTGVEDAPGWSYCRRLELPSLARRGSVPVRLPEAGALMLYDARGRLAAKRHCPAGESRVDLAALPAGVYFAALGEGPSPRMRLVLLR